MDELIKSFEVVLRGFQVGNSPQAFLVLVSLAFARLVTFLSIAPFFGGSAVSGKIKTGTALALVIIVYPTLAETMPANGELPFGSVGFGFMLVKETAVGYCLGYLTSLIFDGITTAGRIIDLQRGASQGEVHAPQVQMQVSDFGQFKLQFALVIFLSMGFHRFFLRALLISFQLLPVTKFPHLQPGWSPLLAEVVKLSTGVILVGVQLAAPVIVALLLTDVCFGLINRVSPQVNVFFLSMPVKMGLGALVVYAALGLYQQRYIYFFKEGYKYFESLIYSLSRTYQP